MMDYYDLSKTILFQGTTPEEVETMLNCLGAERRQYAKGQMICRTGDIVSSLGIVLSGSVLVENDDLWGNSTVLDRIGPGQIFAETYACTPGEPLMVNVVVPESAEVLFLQVGRILEGLLDDVLDGACPPEREALLERLKQLINERKEP